MNPNSKLFYWVVVNVIPVVFIYTQIDNKFIFNIASFYLYTLCKFLAT